MSGNWKMNHNHFEAIQTVQKLGYLLGTEDYEVVDASVHPPFTDIRSVQTTIESEKKIEIFLGAQSCHWEESGAYTGEVAPGMLAKLNVSYVIVGHSERRELFFESDESVNKKVHAVFKHGMTPILCCGETLEEREAGQTLDKVRLQVTAGTNGVDHLKIGELVIAYEPIWAIGTGKTATAADAQEVCAEIRQVVGETFGKGWASQVRIQYGGSVKAANAAELMAQPDIDGLLVGGASLDADEFARIVKYRQSGLNAVIAAAETGEVPAAVKVVPDLAPPPQSPATRSAEWLVASLAAYAAATGQPLGDGDIEMLKTPASRVAEHAEMRDQLMELNNRTVPLIRHAIESAKNKGNVVQTEVRKGLRIPQDWAFHYGAANDGHEVLLIVSMMQSALGRNLLAGERRDWKSK
ncbi:MAG: triose-phosphate isomerase [Actinobacteria bacterium]|nr:triose-phosphate isomerase [Actinomycetota bacterium]